MLLRCERLEPSMSQMGDDRSFDDVGSLLAHIEKMYDCVGTILGGVVHVWRGTIHARTQDD